jgi:hypothetical protein
MLFAPRSARSALARRAAAAAATTTLAALLLAPAADALIVPQRGIAGVRLKMTRAQVVRAKGRPDAERLVRNELIGRQRMMRYGRTRVLFGGFRQGAGVVTIVTRDPGQRTRSGVGTGSSEAALRARIAAARCRTEFGTRHCWTGRFRAGQRVTDFTIGLPGRRVTAVTVGFVID